MDEPWSVPFMGREPSDPLELISRTGVTISGLQFENIGSDVSSIRLTDCHDVTITECDFRDVCQGITVDGCTDITIEWCRYENITGPHERNGSNRANFTQWINTHGGLIRDNKGRGGDTEDIVSLFSSGGNSDTDRLVVERNHFEGTTWESNSGSGMMTGDAGGAHIMVRDNTLLNPGQVGIGIASGTDIHLVNNTIYGEQRTNSNIGIYVWNQYETTCTNHEVSNNQVAWTHADGYSNGFWDAGNCGTVQSSGNDFSADLDPSTLGVTLKTSDSPPKTAGVGVW